jgi:hypothetical protein
VVEGLSLDPAVWPQQLQAQEQRLRLPAPLAQWQLNVRALPSPAPGPLLVAADRAAVDGWIEVFAQAGLTLDRLEPVQTCWMEALLPQLQQQNAQELLVLLHQERNGSVWMLVWSGMQPVYAECLQGDLEAGLPVLGRRWQALKALRQAERSRIFWDGPSDALSLEKPASLPAIQPVERVEYGCLALAGLARSELPEAQLDR